MSINFEEMQRAYVDLNYKFDVYKNRYKKYLDQSFIDGSGNLCMRNMACKDSADIAEVNFKQAYANYQKMKEDYKNGQQT